MIKLNGPDIIITPPAGQGVELKQELGARKADNGAWRLPATSLNVLRVMEFYGDDAIDGAPDEVRELANEQWGFKPMTTAERAEAAKHPAWNRLYPYQREAVEYLYGNPHAAGLLGIFPGGGKAAVSIVASELMEFKRVLVLAPLTLARNWRRELGKWSDEDPAVKRATADDRAPLPEGWTIANHEVIQEVVLRDEDGNVLEVDWARNAKRVKEWIAEGPTKINQKSKKVPARERIVRLRRDYAAIEWDAIIVDESVLFKNRKALKTEVFMQLRKRTDPFVWLLSGSPTTKYRDDLHRQLQVMYPRAFASYWRTAEFFCVVDKEGWGWTIEGDRPDRDPHHYLRDFLHVVSEEDAQLDLPEYIHRDLELDATPRQRKALDAMLKDWIVELDEAPGEPVIADNWLARSTRLQQITSNLGALPKPDGDGFFKESGAKTDALIELIRQEDVSLPMLVWTWFIETTELVKERLEKTFPELKVGAVHGRMKREDKDALFEAYEAGELDVLVTQLGVGKFGHTLTNTRTVFYHDRAFDSDAWFQSLRRVKRIGLEHRPVLIVPRVHASHDEFVDANLEGKLRSIASMTNSDLAELLRALRGGSDD